MDMKVILILLPKNATHLINLLDIYVFNPFKTFEKRTGEHMVEKYVTYFSNSKDFIISS